MRGVVTSTALNLTRATDPSLDGAPPPARVDHRLNNFTLLRLLAALQVVVGHSVKWLEPDLRGGWLDAFRVFERFAGVSIFFVISGFLISASWERQPDLRRYARNRALRIFPGLWVCVGASLVLLAAFGFLGSFVTSTAFLPWLIGQLTVGQFFNPDALRGFGSGAVNGALWTISVEIGFYLVLPVLYALVIRRWRRATGVLLGLALASFALWYALMEIVPYRDSTALKLLFQTFAPHVHLFIVGILLQRGFDRVRGLLVGRAAVWLSVFTSLQVLDVVAFQRALGDDPAFLLASRAALAMLAISFAYSLPGLSARAVGEVDISYGVYLYHVLVINAFIELGWMHDLVLLPIVVVLSLVLGAASWFLVESRALRWKRGGLLARAW